MEVANQCFVVNGKALEIGTKFCPSCDIKLTNYKKNINNKKMLLIN